MREAKARAVSNRLPLAEMISSLVRNTDVIQVIPGAGAVRVLLVGGELEDLRTIVQRIISEVSLYMFAGEGTFVVKIGGACYPATAGSSASIRWRFLARPLYASMER